ncbi:hypothetical protein ACF0H5_012675 [Mactra antiquata]
MFTLLFSYSRCIQIDHGTHTCDNCWLSSNPSGHFSLDSFTVSKIECSDKYCASCTENGCLNGGQTYSYIVTCEKTGYDSTGQHSGTYSLTAQNAAAPNFTYSAGSSIAVFKATGGVGTVINTIQATVQDNPEDFDTITYVQNSGPAASFIHSTADLFYLDTNNGQVKVLKDLSSEFSYYYSMNLCVTDRRNRQVCHVLSITLHACFQTPNCTDLQDTNLHDTFGTYTGHGGASNVVFQMVYPQPNQHFDDFSATWHDLTWSFDSNEFPEAAIDSDTG